MGHEEREYRRGNKAQSLNDERELRVIKEIERDEKVERAGDVGARIEEIAYVIDEQILVLNKVAEHLLEREILIPVSAEALLKLEAGGDHRDNCEHGADYCDYRVVELDLLADEDGAENERNARAHARPNLLIGYNAVSLVNVFAHRGDDTEYRHVAEGVGGIPKYVCDGEPSELRIFAETVGNGEEHDGGQRDKYERYPEPRNELLAALELYLVKQHAENSVVDRVPYLDREHDSRSFDKSADREHEVGRQERGDKVIYRILSAEVEIVAQSLLRFCRPALRGGCDFFDKIRHFL